MMKHASMLMLAAMFGGFTVASAQVEAEIEEKPSLPQQVIVNNMGGMMLNCGGGSFLGIVGDEVNDELVQKLNLPGEYGAIINEVVKESAAEKAGLQKEDVIVGYNGTRVESMAQLRRMIAETPIGRTVDLKIIRNGSEQQITTELGTRQMPMMESFWNTVSPPEIYMRDFNGKMEDMDEEMKEQMEKLEESLKELDGMDLSDGDVFFHKSPEGDAYWFDMGEGAQAFGQGMGEAYAQVQPRLFTRMLLSDGHRLGATVQSLSPQLAKFFKLDEGESGALVSEVHEGGAASKGGLQAGDVVIAIDGEAVKTPMDLTRQISDKEGTVELRVIREGSEQTIKVDLGSREQGFRPRDGRFRRDEGKSESLFGIPESDPDLSLNNR